MEKLPSDPSHQSSNENIVITESIVPPVKKKEEVVMFELKPVKQPLLYTRLQATVPFEELYNTPQRQKYQHQELVTFCNSLSVGSYKKIQRTIYGTSLNPEYENKLDPYVKVCFLFFSIDWKMIRNERIPYKSEKSERVYALPSILYEKDEAGKSPSGDKKKASAKRSSEMKKFQTIRGITNEAQNTEILSKHDLHFQFIKPYDRKVDVENHQRRTASMLGLFEYYDPNYDWQPGTEIALCNRIQRTSPPDESLKTKSFYFTVTPKSMAFQFGDYEPYFFSLALYDIASKRKISETFHVQLNSETSLSLIDGSWKIPQNAVNAMTGLFQVTGRNHNHYLILIVDKVLQGDLDDISENYLKIINVAKQKDQDKLKDKIRMETHDFCKRLGEYRQHFAWSALQVFDQKGNLLLQKDTCFDRICAWTSKDDIFTALQANNNNNNNNEAKKTFSGKDLKGFCGLQVEKITEDALDSLNRVDSSLQEIVSKSKDPNAPLVRELHEFLPNTSLIPHFSYVNNMYIYPLMANLSSKSGRNFAIKMEVKDDDVDLNSPGLSCIYSPSSPTGFVNYVFTEVYHHNKTPHFNTEIKIELPPVLTEKHHLLFTFYHIVCAKKKGDEKAEQLMGYSVVPLYPNRRIVVHNLEGQYGVGILNKLEPPYLSKIYNESPKFNFFLKFDLISTIYPEDGMITQFLHVYHTTEEEFPDEQLVEVLNGLKDLSELLAIQYLPVIINNLLEVMTTRKKLEPKIMAFRALTLVLHKVSTKLNERVPRNSLLEMYTNYIFDQTFGTKKPVFQELCSNFLLYMMEKSQTHDKTEDGVFHNSWFFFDVIIKSMTLFLNDKGLLNTEMRTNIFSDEMVRLITKLLDFLARFFLDHVRSNLIEEIKILNKNLALFMKDLILIFDRGIVIDMIKSFLERLTDYSVLSIASTFKFEFLRIIIDSENYLCLNLLFDKGDLNIESLSKKHSLSTIVIYEVMETLKNCENSINEIAIGVLYDIITKNVFHSNLQSEHIQREIARIYLVLVPLVIENWEELSKWKSTATYLQKREFYITVLYVLSVTDRDIIKAWWKQESLKNQVTFYAILNDIIKTFEYTPELKRTPKSLLTPVVALFMRTVGTPEMNELLKCISISQHSPEDEDRRLRQLTLAVYNLVLDIMEEFMEEDKDELRQHQNISPKMMGIVSTFVLLMNMRLSEPFVHNLYASLRSFAHRFKNVLFLGENNFVAELVRELLLHCNAAEDYIHIEASTFLFILLKLNFKLSNSFGRTRIHTITVLSKLVYEGIIKADVNLNYSFARLNGYAMHAFSTLSQTEIAASVSEDHLSYVHAMFARSVQELASTLSFILKDTLRINELRQKADNDTIAELYYQIAESYKNTPDLRISWLQSLAKFQEQKGKLVESGMCLVHVAALISDYLNSTGEDIDTSLFTSISPYLKEFSDPGEEGVCKTRDFSVEGLVTALITGIERFQDCEYFEYASMLYKVLIPLYESRYATKELSISYNRLEKIWSSVAEKNEQRLFGKFYRLGFYGELFGEELNGREFVTKEPKLTHLLELNERLVKELSKKTNCPIELLDSSKDISQIDKSKCYIQVTFLEPYLPVNSSSTMTFFERNSCLSQFTYETPFTKSGKAHADSVAEQFKRKTILTVQNCFPNLLSRLPVIKKQDVILTPIENAIDNIRKRNLLIKSEIAASGNNVKTLQQVLQGSVRLQVNEGATAICKIFLSDYNIYPKEHVLELIECAQEFLTLCKNALYRNFSFITTEKDKEFHQEMESGFVQVEAEMNYYIAGVHFPEEKSSEASSSILEEDDTDEYSEPGSPRSHKSAEANLSDPTVPSIISISQSNPSPKKLPPSSPILVRKARSGTTTTLTPPLPPKRPPRDRSGSINSPLADNISVSNNSNSNSNNNINSSAPNPEASRPPPPLAKAVTSSNFGDAKLPPPLIPPPQRKREEK